MRLTKIREYLNRKGIPHTYFEEAGCSSIDFIRSGLSYHIWEFPEDEQGAESNVRTAGRMEVYGENYEEEILALLKTW